MTRRSLITPAVLAVVAVAGCGGSKGLSRSELIAKADPLCRKANHTLDASKINPQNLSTLAPTIAATEQQVTAELKKLSPPSAMAADWKVIVDGFRRTGEGFRELGSVAKASSPTKPSKAFIEAEREVTGGQHDRAVTAARNGFKDCSNY